MQPQSNDGGDASKRETPKVAASHDPSRSLDTQPNARVHRTRWHELESRSSIAWREQRDGRLSASRRPHRTARSLRVVHNAWARGARCDGETQQAHCARLADRCRRAPPLEAFNADMDRPRDDGTCSGWWDGGGLTSGRGQSYAPTVRVVPESRDVSVSASGNAISNSAPSRAMDVAANTWRASRSSSETSRE